MKVITVVNQKGGVGKTTTAISLAGALSTQGYKVLLVDLDPQASLSQYLGFNVDSLNATLYDVFTQDDASLEAISALHATPLNQIAILPAHGALATLDKQFGTAQGKGLVIRKALGQLDTAFDYAIVDCPPSLGVLMINGLLAADAIVLPTQTEHLALKGLQSMLSTIDQLTNSLKPNVVKKVVATLFDRRVNACINTYNKMRVSHAEYIWRGYIPNDTKFRDASEKGVPVNVVAKQCRGAFAYDKLANELVAKLA
ncbi:ParA family protein [Ningiella sp. W23]|uniref:ParA family protein n=1 Tax=Ningiella sp. W23 TaxID=3023715 RepID=UPI003758295D